MSQKIQTKLNDSAHICQVKDNQLLPCGYHSSRVDCEFLRIDDDLLAIDNGTFHGFLQHNSATRTLAKWFCAERLPAGSWYLVREQRLWLLERVKRCLFDAGDQQRIDIMVAGVASYVHAMGQLSIITQASEESQFKGHIGVTFTDRCEFPLLQISAFMRAIQEKPFTRYKISVGKQRYKVPKTLDREARKRRQQWLNLEVDCRQCDLADSEAFQAQQFDIVTEHFMTSLLYKKFAAIEPIRANYARWLKAGGRLLTADGLRQDAEVYAQFVHLNNELGLANNTDATQPVWDPYGLQQETFQNINEGSPRQRVAIELDNTLSEFIKV